jgi:hypothetical protein
MSILTKYQAEKIAKAAGIEKPAASMAWRLWFAAMQAAYAQGREVSQ